MNIQSFITARYNIQNKKNYSTYILLTLFSKTYTWSKLKQSESFPLLIYLYLVYSQQTSQTLFPNMSYQFDSIAHNIIFQSVVPRQILSLNRTDTPCFRPKPTPSINNRCCPSVLGRLPSRNLSCIRSNLEMELNSWVAKSTINCCKQQWCST